MIARLDSVEGLFHVSLRTSAIALYNHDVGKRVVRAVFEFAEFHSWRED